MGGKYNMLRAKAIMRDLPQRLFDNHVNNATVNLYLADVKF